MHDVHEGYFAEINDSLKAMKRVAEMQGERISRVEPEVVDVKTKLPIWVFKLSVSILIVIMGGINFYITAQYRELAAKVDRSVTLTDKIMKNMSKDVREMKMNQENILHQLKIKPVEIPPYYGGDLKR